MRRACFILPFKLCAKTFVYTETDDVIGTVTPTDSRPYGFRQEHFFYVFPYISLCKTCGPGTGPFLPQGLNLNKLGSGPLGNATYQISRL